MSTALIAKFRVGAPPGHGFPVPVVAGGVVAVGVVQLPAGAALPGSGCRSEVWPGRDPAQPPGALAHPGLAAGEVQVVARTAAFGPAVEDERAAFTDAVMDGVHQGRVVVAVLDAEPRP